ncbi:hypothetical protein Sked_25310 [Sanguibacter keddieii DSM 10542]|uniref:Uncharacterized protein n=1 Tax=Sanguibacter keddieii (strain ATCC 51767 / DSM 10542 / NCFB 3025 / ST-74) TaxID=446469 RepID=D1BK26_SANKS|nr:hypothetical protein [Sanguibacter keddieii]ACZ22435.1 hypothetical protein Sked_25310 [Sanguibacter keddieii DSM 10542]
MLCAALLTACGGEADDQVASAGSPSASSSSGTSSTDGSDRGDLTRQQQAQQQADCLRENGLHVGDPDQEGYLGATVEDGRISDADRAAAYAACEHLAPEQTAEDKTKQSPEAMRAFAVCMRENGIDWPDPNADGSTNVTPQHDFGVDDGTLWRLAQQCGI